MNMNRKTCHRLLVADRLRVSAITILWRYRSRFQPRIMATLRVNPSAHRREAQGHRPGVRSYEFDTVDEGLRAGGKRPSADFWQGEPGTSKPVIQSVRKFARSVTFLRPGSLVVTSAAFAISPLYPSVGSILRVIPPSPPGVTSLQSFLPCTRKPD